VTSEENEQAQASRPAQKAKNVKRQSFGEKKLKEIWGEEGWLEA